MAKNCRAAVFAVNTILQTESGSRQLRALMTQAAPDEEFVSVITQGSDPETAATLQTEFAALPRSFMSTWLIAWQLADVSGQSFEMISEPAPRPLEYAKAGRVAYRIEHDIEGVRMYVSHVHGHHADWFKPAATEGVEAIAAAV